MSDDSSFRGGDAPPRESGETDRFPTVQDYIDETPFWADGTRAPAVPMTSMQSRIWVLASAGKFFEGLVVFMTGVALPLMAQEFGLTAMEKGALGSGPLFGILLGASVLGGLSDRYGRKRMFIVEMILFAVCLLGLVLSQSQRGALLFLFGTGAALGCDYPTAHLIISETIPSAKRGALVLSAFAFQAVGALVGTAVGYLILSETHSLGAWRWMYASALLPAVMVCIGRFFIPDSGVWLSSRGRYDEAVRETKRLLRRTPPYPARVELARVDNDKASPEHLRRGGYAHLFAAPIRRATILASVPWFLQDLGTYGIGLFTPTILATVIGADTGNASNVAALIQQDLMASKGAAFLDVILLFGMIAAILLVEKTGRIRLQIAGFVGCALGLALVAMSLDAQGAVKTVLLFSGFMLFNFMTNLGPNSMTYLIAGEVFPTRMRAKGMGLAASLAKVGAATTVFLFPVLLYDIGTQKLLIGLTAASLLGALVTWAFGIETTGVNLERADHAPHTRRSKLSR